MDDMKWIKEIKWRIKSIYLKKNNEIKTLTKAFQ